MFALLLYFTHTLFHLSSNFLSIRCPRTKYYLNVWIHMFNGID